jgi:hypothetical protein
VECAIAAGGDDHHVTFEPGPLRQGRGIAGTWVCHGSNLMRSARGADLPACGLNTSAAG